MISRFDGTCNWNDVVHDTNSCVARFRFLTVLSLRYFFCLFLPLFSSSCAKARMMDFTNNNIIKIMEAQRWSIDPTDIYDRLTDEAVIWLLTNKSKIWDFTNFQRMLLRSNNQHNQLTIKQTNTTNNQNLTWSVTKASIILTSPIDISHHQTTPH